MKKERNIQSEIMTFLKGDKRKGVKGVGGWWLNFHGGSVYMPRGIPDIIGCYHGRFVAFEVKRPGETPTAIQIFTIKSLRSSGAVASVVYSIEDVRETLEKLKEGEKR